MTHRDIYTKFMIEYDKANVTSSYPSLTPYEVATILDKAYLALIARKVTGNNPRRSQLESDIKAVSDLAPLITTENCSLRLVGRNIASYILPEKFLYYVNSTMDYNTTGNPLDGINSRLLPITLTTHNVAEKFLATLYNMPWVKNPVCYLEDDTMYVVYDPINKPAISSSAHLTYIKAPAKFAGASDFDPSNAPMYEPDPVIEPDDDEPVYNPGGNNNQGETDAPGGNEQQGGLLGGQGQLGGQQGSTTRWTLWDSESRCTWIPSKGKYSVNLVFRGSSDEDWCNGINYSIVGTPEYTTVIEEPDSRGVCYITPVSLTSNGPLSYSVTIKAFCSEDRSVTGTKTFNIAPIYVADGGQSGADPGLEVPSGNTSTATFDFTRPSTLNPQIEIDDQHTEVLVYDKVFTSGLVTLKFTHYGQGVVIKRTSDGYRLEMRQDAAVTVSVGNDCTLKQVYVTGSPGTLLGLNSGYKSWNAPNSNTTSKEFENGTEETSIQTLVVKYESKGSQSGSNYNVVVNKPDGSNSSSSSESHTSDGTHNYWYDGWYYKELTGNPGEVAYEAFYFSDPMRYFGSYCNYYISNGSLYAELEVLPSNRTPGGTLVIIKPKVADGKIHTITVANTFSIPSNALGSQYPLNSEVVQPWVEDFDVIKIPNDSNAVMLEYDTSRTSGGDYRVTLSQVLNSNMSLYKFRMLVEVVPSRIPDEWKSRVVDGWMIWEEKNSLSLYNDNNPNTLLYHLPLADLRDSDSMFMASYIKVLIVEGDNVICESNKCYII